MLQFNQNAQRFMPVAGSLKQNLSFPAIHWSFVTEERKYCVIKYFNEFDFIHLDVATNRQHIVIDDHITNTYYSSYFTVETMPHQMR